MSLCSKCGGDDSEKYAATVYCVDCDQNFCESCCVRHHHPGTATERHSLEKIAKAEGKSVLIVTPIAEEFLLTTVIYIIWQHSFIQEDYLTNATICPMGAFGRKTVASFDAGLFYLFKGALNWECNMEDAYWRLFSDAWVRNVITSSDGVPILLTSLFRAWVFKQAIAVTVVPVFSMMYSVIFMVFSSIEGILPRSEPWVSIENLAARFDVLPFESSMPPETQPRCRPYEDWVELWTYWKGRYLRKWTAFYKAAAVALLAAIEWPVKYVVFFRVACMAVPALGPAIRTVLGFCGVQTSIDRHLDWFSNSMYLDHDFTDRAFWSVLGSSYSFLTSGVLSQVLGPVLHLTKVFLGEGVANLWALFIPVGIYFFIKRQINQFLETQRAKFKAEWNGGIRERVLGGCPPGDHNACQCQCVIDKCKK